MKTKRLCCARSLVLVIAISATIPPTHYILISYPALPNIPVAVLCVMTACILYPVDRGSMSCRNIALLTTAPHAHIITKSRNTKSDPSYCPISCRQRQYVLPKHRLINYRAACTHHIKIRSLILSDILMPVT